MSRPDEGLIHTWLDGECTPEEAVRIERLVATDPEWSAAVAEARGLVAASARIVQALDAVPRALPAGSRATPASVQRTAYRVRPWMRIAAGVVLVAGTAVLMREEPSPFAPSAAVDIAPAAPPALADSGPVTSRSVVIAQVPIDVPVGNVGTLERVPPPPTAGAPAPFVLEPQVPPQAAPPAPPMAAASGRAAQLSAEYAKLSTRQEEERRATLRERPSSDVARSAAAPAPMADALAGAVAEKALPTLAGCWRVRTPPELVGVLREPMIVRQSGDTLVLRTARGDLTVTRTSDGLRGGLEATLEPCPTDW